ncbi:Na+ dependent nucleoside transporter domain protein OS=Tsukamurella paurometabola (strain ATCC 8368/ DSM / CCUG 35730 / CIP 100753 / JCM 10117 / KCTC 9821/ NBRC 16120 / NCIMB 702349 / NCTC 13040) OX=521096 GN=Tpau_1150 PE=3 SV=1 [Tsukamurella paurometabola]|uniref:Na+ dependent nucleoside transporter domain protein n=1 Tax=Tsukamurella paurometabola (strain ATCC 8368 / DSM 20162 / CCUG 35730 / CIP 100753 / JCM 10117 / KCTC 9821 / NBRC 16120 / NCIMB 702349 / NCTC 13040) TaxID=521096 RepID=D5UVX4_TSUPD|nr:nucleoside transporter C-terminal domain-containing protein [Tsukamurella paurometabola]ADG77781.1 Na+ dependent nucleoside transporter domain protein [Tsukamurella paurometabola DSM 20162]SUP28732.1 Nucleoside-transport system protein nupC [Tsukamurella paurometabola]
MHVIVGVFGLIVFLLLAFLPTRDVAMLKKKAPYIALMLVIQFGLGLLMLKTPVGKTVIDALARGFKTLLGYAHEGTSFVFGGLVDYKTNPDGAGPFFMNVLLPIIVISSLIGILQFLKLLPLIIKYLGLAISKVTGMPKLESFNAVSSAIIGQSENFIAIKKILPTLPSNRLYTLSASAMSTVSMSIVGSYMVMIQPKYVVAAIVLNLFGAFIIVSLLNPYEVAPEDDVFAAPEQKKQSFFEMLGEYILDGAKVALTVAAMLIGFVALIALVNGIFAAIFNGTTFQEVLGHVFAPLAWLTGVPWSECVQAGQIMATKLVSNEFVAMLSFTSQNPGGAVVMSERATAIVQTFLVSFANFSSIGIIAGAAKSLAPDQGDQIAKFGLKLLYGATLVSFLSATVVGLIS